MSLILFVCTGNLCRSPMAEALFRQKVEAAGMDRDLQVRSAGVWAQEGHPASRDAVAVMAEQGLDLRGHRAHLLTGADMAEADLVLVMTSEHRSYLQATWPQYDYKVKRLAEVGGKRRDIDDPYGRTREDYRATADEISAYLDKGLRTILRAV